MFDIFERACSCRVENYDWQDEEAEPRVKHVWEDLAIPSIRGDVFDLFGSPGFWRKRPTGDESKEKPIWQSRKVLYNVSNTMQLHGE
jgi:hypothetical protein